MRSLVVETPEGVELRHELAGAGSRFAAGALDAALFLVGWASLLLAAAWIASFDPTRQLGFVAGLATGGALLGLVGFHILFALAWQGQSPGKRVLGLRVWSADGAPATSQQIVLRSLFWPLEAALIVSPVPIALVLMTVTDRAQRLGDLVAGTLVVREPVSRVDGEPLVGEVFGRGPRPALGLVPALAARVGDAEYELLRDVLARRGMQEPARTRLLERTAHAFGERLDLELGADPPAELRELYLYLRERRESAPLA